MGRSGKTFTRQELYDLVWSRPGRDIARELGISDVGLSKMCRRAHVPRPGLGYWAKKAAGKPTLKPALPQRGLGEADEVQLGGRAYWMARETDEEILSAPIAPPPSFPEKLAEVSARAKSLVGKVRIPANLTNRHPLIDIQLQEDERRREKQRASSYPLSWEAPRFDSPSGRRKLRILNALFLSFSRCGCRPSLHVREELAAGVQVGGQRISFTLESRTPKIQRRSQTQERSTTQRETLKLAIAWWQSPPDIQLSWEDGTESLESQVTSIAVGILVAGEWSYRSSVQRHFEWRIERKKRLEDEIRRAREEAERLERERQLRIEKDRRDRLVAEVRAWNLAADIRRYVQAVQARQDVHADSSGPSQGREWVAWALAEANRLDPLGLQDSRWNVKANEPPEERPS
jgi:hypothetical protein